ncbi:MAG: NAD-dependent epimerase/dehydratase family protein [Saprospiraceae bacterium]|nr:NAD-dependent epimerase/dehydratase family protein [Saprospiraceae bacterium]
MYTSRRTFLQNSTKLAAALTLAASGLSSCTNAQTDERKDAVDENKPLKILILGGTSFLGPHQIKAALDRGHQISTFTRGKTKPTIHQDLFSEVEALVGDRENDLKALEGRDWDVVIDNSGRRVEWTKKTAELLRDRVGQYVYISSTGVYYPYLTEHIKEDQPLVMEVPSPLEDEEQKLEYGYGVMKANSEQAAKAVFGEERTLVIRPTYMVGPADKTDRFIHWPIRLSQGGKTLVPGKTGDPVQYIDVRDVADWMIQLIEAKTTGVFNAVGPAEAQDMYTFVEKASTAFDLERELIQIDDYDFLKANKIPYLIPWILPEGNNWGSARVNNQLAVAKGLSFRPLADTIRDTHDWWISDGVSQEQRDKVMKDAKGVLMREAEVLAAWEAIQNKG